MVRMHCACLPGLDHLLTVSPMKFLHCADLHVDSPLRGLERYEGAPVDEARAATRRAFENMVSLALNEQVAFVLIAGDLYDDDWPDFNTGLFFARQMGRLADAGIRAFIVRGNHDASSRITRALRLPANVHVFGDRAASSVVLDDLGVAVHGRSFATGAVSDDLAARYPDSVPGLFNIGVLHTSLNGRPGHASYAPTSLDVLRTRGYQYWALGHVHAHEIVATDPWVVYPGNAQGRHARETGPKGCVLVEWDGSRVECRFEALDVLRWCVVDVDIGGLDDVDALMARVSAAFEDALGDCEGRLLALRVQVVGAGPLHRDVAGRHEQFAGEVRALANERFGGRAWVEKVRVSTAPELDLDALAGRDDPLGLLLRRLDALAADETARAALGARALSELQAKLPAELRAGDAGFDLSTPQVLADLVAETRAELVARLSAGPMPRDGGRR